MQKEAQPISDTPTDFYAIYTQLSDAERALLARWRAFLLAEVDPIANDAWERGEFPQQLIPKLGALMVETISHGQRYYPVMRPLLSGMLTMEIARVDPSMASFFGVHRRLCMQSIYLYGSDAQKERWLPDMLTLKKIGSWVITEPNVGSAAARGLETTATPVAGGYVLTGQKKWSGNASFADVNCIWARRADGGAVNAFLVERGAPGYHIEPVCGKISKRTVDNVLITLENCFVPEDNRLAHADSFRAAAEQLNNARSEVAWESVGLSMGAYENALRYANARVQFDRPISAFQLSQEKLVKMLANITAAQTLLAQLSVLAERDGEVSAERASLAKFFCTERMRENVALARELLGGNGILLEHNVARFFADAEAVYSYEGTRDMQLLIVGKAITGHSAFV
jgi:glutaryl-CoA dehydrogenase